MEHFLDKLSSDELLGLVAIVGAMVLARRPVRRP